MYLQNNDLTGTIPGVLYQATNLKRLHLDQNSLNGGGIKTTLGDLSNLTSLKLFGNTLRGTIPSEIGRLTALTALQMREYNARYRCVFPGARVL